MRARVRHAVILLLTVFAGMARATSIKPVELSDLFREAEVVALVSVDGGDARAFKQAIYRATVNEGFKGTTAGKEIYFGPYASYRVGGEYIVFLDRAQEKVGETLKRAPSPWPEASEQPLLRVMYAGYSALPVEYTCVFEKCAHGVSVPSSQVLLPSALARTPEERVSTRYDAWVERDAFLKILRGYNASPK